MTYAWKNGAINILKTPETDLKTHALKKFLYQLIKIFETFELIWRKMQNAKKGEEKRGQCLLQSLWRV